jgi:transcriptional regulator with XRE-family HTH domain
MTAAPQPDPIDVEVGARIRARRKEAGFSQTRVADALGLSFQQQQKYERGTNRVSASMLVKIARALDTTVSALVGEGDANVPHGAQVFQALNVPGALNLLNAYASIDGAEVRRSILHAAKMIAKAGGRD